MEHQSLYRKYRSQAFEEVFGQQHVTRTLQNALSSGRVAHAYLFCGPRGTGKTSTARLLAKALNCVNGPTPTPCNECELCVSITAGRALDVVEVDAASETGIDNVREVIINNSRYAPALGGYKVYIIDEVHDLSRAAFDGLLKTLEEPPAHVVFVLATTEIHKVPATIISRCQRFEFRRGSLDEVRSRVDYVASQEGVTLEPAAATLISRAAQGGWRDALSLLEQVMSFGDKTITSRDVGLVLGAIEDEHLEALTRQVAGKNPLGALKTLDTLLAEGKDLRQLLHNLSDYIRDCLLSSLGAAAEVTRTVIPLDKALAMHLLEQTSRAEREMRWNTLHRLVLELMLLRMAAPAAATAPAVTSSAAESEVSSPVAAPSAAPPSATTTRDAPGPIPTRPRGPLIPRSGSRPGVSPPLRNADPVFAASGNDPVDAAASQDPGAIQPRTAEPVLALSLETIQQQWKVALNRVGSKSRKLQALLREATPAEHRDGVLTLEFKQQYHCQAVEEMAARRDIESILAQVYGTPVRVNCRLTEDPSARPAPAAAARKALDEPVTDAVLAELFPGWDIREG